MKATKFRARLVKFIRDSRISPLVFPGVPLKTDKEVLRAIETLVEELAAPVSDQPSKNDPLVLAKGPKSNTVDASTLPDGQDDETEDKGSQAKNLLCSKQRWLEFFNLPKFAIQVPSGFFVRACPQRELRANQVGVTVFKTDNPRFGVHSVGRILISKEGEHGVSEYRRFFEGKTDILTSEVRAAVVLNHISIKAVFQEGVDHLVDLVTNPEKGKPKRR